ncbi:MAG: hypothetical protein E5Y14_07990 [Mesorhizobium sp.]|nr:MAG: hypothetical protein E5Y14_07990 [Mesorhizobium sp.]
MIVRAWPGECSGFRRRCALFRRSLRYCGAEPFETPAGQRPPLPYRASPPLGGRSAVVPAFANLQHRSRSAAPKLPISPLVGPSRGRWPAGQRGREGSPAFLVQSSA